MVRVVFVFSPVGCLATDSLLGQCVEVRDRVGLATERVSFDIAPDVV